MDAAELRRRTGITLRDRIQRVRLSAIVAIQASIAAGLAWSVAHNLVGHVQPFFAPIAAIIVLAISVGQRLRRAVEVVLGNAFGILVGELIILFIGHGAWQVALVVLGAMVGVIFIGGSSALMTQAATSGALVATLIAPTEYYYVTRFLDAVIGGVIGLLVMALLLPLNPLTVVGRAADQILDELAEGLRETAAALDARDADKAQVALDALRDAEVRLRGFAEAINAGREISAVAPVHWRKRDALAQYVDSINHVARALRNTRVLVRRTVTMVEECEKVPPTLVEAVYQLAAAVASLRRELGEGTEPQESRSAAVRAARSVGEAYRDGVDFSGSVLVAQVRSIAVDLLRATGLPGEEASRAIRRAGRATPSSPPAG